MTVDPGDFGLAASSLAFKLELFQHTGSFKPRGGFANLLTRPISAAGVVAASGGNHGVAVAFAAMRLGIKATIFVPKITPQPKLDRIRAYGAELVVKGEAYADAAATSEALAAQTGALAVHPYDQAETMLGQGSLGMELEADLPEIDQYMNNLVPMVVEQTNRGERAYDIYSSLLKGADHFSGRADRNARTFRPPRQSRAAALGSGQLGDASSSAELGMRRALSPILSQSVAPEMPSPPCSSEAAPSSPERRAEIEGERLEAGIDHRAVLRRLSSLSPRPPRRVLAATNAGQGLDEATGFSEIPAIWRSWVWI
jgi:hypothetical protein